MGHHPASMGSWGGCGAEESHCPSIHIPSKERSGIWGQAVPKAKHHVLVWGVFPLARLKGGFLRGFVEYITMYSTGSSSSPGRTR